MANGIIKFFAYKKGSHYPSNDAPLEVRISWETTANATANTSTAFLTLQVRKKESISGNHTEWLASSAQAYDENSVGSTMKIGPQWDTPWVNITFDDNEWVRLDVKSYTITHSPGGIAPGLVIACNVVNGGNEWLYDANQSDLITFDKIIKKATITSAPNFNDTQNPTIKYSNPMGSYVDSLQVCIANSTGNTIYVPYRDVSKTGTSYTFNLTTKERQALINAVGSGTSMTIRFYIKMTIYGEDHRSSVNKTFTLTDAMPDLAPAVVDMNETTKALTGDMNKLVKYHSQAACSTNGTVKQGATIKSQKVVNGAITKTNTTGVFAIPNVESGKFEFSITDSRNNTTTATITKTLIEYVKLTCNQNVQMGLVGEQNARAEITVSGNYFNDTFGAVKNNLVVEVRHKEQNGEYGPWVNELTDGITLSDAIVFDGNTYSLTFGISELQYDKTYVFQARATDKLSSITTNEYTIKLLPVFDWSGNDFNFNVPVSFQGEEMADFVIAQGTEAMGTNGTWYWSKWKSGKAECYGVRNYGNMAINVAFGSMYGSADFTQALPSGLFMAAPDYVGITPMSGGSGTWVNSGYGTEATASATGTFQLVRPNSKTLSQAKISFHVIGRWK